MKFENQDAFSPEHLHCLSTEEQLDYILEKFNLLEAQGLGHKIPSRFRLPNARYLLKVQKNNTQALIRYKPQTYHGRITLFRAREQPVNAQGELGRGLDQVAPHLSEMLKDPQLGWGGLASGGIEIIDIPGSHYTILHGDNVPVLARLIRNQIDKAQKRT
jgi:thioesterase domain-containing protein